MTETTHMRREILEIPDAAARLLDASDGALAAAGRQLRELSPRFLTTVARGSSDHAAAFLKYVVELTAGVPVASLGPSIASIYGAKLKLDGSACLTISQSGKSPDIVAMAQAARAGGALTIAITNTAGSPLAEASDHAIDILAGVEKSVAATKSFVNSALAGLLLLAHWVDDRELLAALRRLPEHLRKAIDCDWMQVSGALTGENSLFILGRGPSVAIANEAALKFKETCAMHAEAYSAAEVMHGPLALVGPGFPVRGARRARRLRAVDRGRRRRLVGQGRVGLRDVGAGGKGTCAAACGDRPSDHRSADADRVLLCLRRGVRAASRPQSRPAAEPAQGDGDAMSDAFALPAKRIFDGEAWHDDAALVVRGGIVEAIVSRAKIPAGAETIEAGDMLAPGFVDLQVNGGGGVMLNDHPDCRGHRDDLPGACAVRHHRAAADADHRHARGHARRRSPPASRRRGARCPALPGCISKGRTSPSPARARTTRS